MSKQNRRRFLELLAVATPVQGLAGQFAFAGSPPSGAPVPWPIPSEQGGEANTTAETKGWERFSTAYFTYPRFAEKVTREQIQGKVRDAAESGSNVLMFFIMHEGFALYPSAVTERYPYAQDIDVLAEVIKEAKANNLKVVASWLGVHGISRLAEIHPSWRWRDAEGNWAPLFHRLCLNSPFQSQLLAQVREVLAQYQVDGIYFDGIYELAGGCYCDFCQEKFREVYGRDLPKDPQNPLMTKFRMETVQSACHAIRALVDQSAPQVLFMMDTLGLRVYQSFAQDLNELRKYVDVFILEAYWEYTGKPIWYVGMEHRMVAAETGKPVWFPRWFPFHPNGNFAPIPNATIRLWAGEGLVNAAAPICVEQNIFDIDRSRFPTLKETFGRIKKVTPYLRGATQIPYAALLHSVATKQHLSPNNISDYMDNFQGTYMALLEHHISFEVVTERQLEENGFGDLKVLILSNTLCMSDATLDAIRRYVAAGGGLVVTYRSSFLDESGGERPQMGLADVLGIKPLGLIVRRGPLRPEEHGGREGATFYRVREGEPLGKGLEGDFSSFMGGFVKVAPAKGVHVAAQALDYDYSRQENPFRKWAWWPGKPSYPLIVTREAPGRVAYIAGELDNAFWQHGLPEAGQLIANAIQWAGGVSPIEVEAPGAVQAVVFESPSLDKGLLCCLSNRSANPLYLTSRASSNSEFQFVREVAPAHNVRVKIRKRANKIIQAAALSGQIVDARFDGESVNLTVPVLVEYEAVILRW